MAVNSSHANGGVLIHQGECILLFCKKVTLEMSEQHAPEFRGGSKHGRLYLTTHRLIFNSEQAKDPLQSFSMPFCTLSEVEIEQPVFGANFIKGKVRAQPQGGWTGEAKFKLHFKTGGAIEFGQAMLMAAQLVKSRAPPSAAGAWEAPPPPYFPTAGNWQTAPPPAYAPPPGGYYGWAPPTHVFPDVPPQGAVYTTNVPPPYPGLIYGPAASAPPAQNGAMVGPPSAFYDPSHPQVAYVPPAYGFEAPPTYQDATARKNQ